MKEAAERQSTPPPKVNVARRITSFSNEIDNKSKPNTKSTVTIGKEVNEPLFKREYVAPLFTRDGDNSLFHRRITGQNEGSSSSNDRSKPASVLQKRSRGCERVNCFLNAVQLNMVKFRYLYATLLVIFTAFCVICYTGHKVNQTIKNIQDHLADYAVNVVSRYFDKASKNVTD